SDLSSGRRRIPDRGNAGSTQTWRLANLPKGNYYWSVQSVDHGFHASLFSPESTFVITNDIDAALNHAPIAQPLEISTPEDQPLPVTLTATDADSDLLTWIVTSQPTNGVLSCCPPALLYLPKTNFFGVYGFRWRVYDGLATSQTVGVAITITPVQDVDAIRLQIFRHPPFLDINLT